MNKSESKYYNTACLMDEALIALLDKKDFEYISIKEICDKAGVNRSTFYLHYENTKDLLEESVKYLNDRFFEAMSSVSKSVVENIEATDAQDLIFITPKYLEPYLSYLKKNNKHFSAYMRHAKLFGAKETFGGMYENIFYPILCKFNLTENEKKYYFSFFFNGILAIITDWLTNGCKEDIDDIIAIMVKCAELRK